MLKPVVCNNVSPVDLVCILRVDFELRLILFRDQVDREFLKADPLYQVFKVIFSRYLEDSQSSWAPPHEFWQREMLLELHESLVYTWAMKLPEPYQICYLGQSLRPGF